MDSSSAMDEHRAAAGGSSNANAALEVFDVGPCDEPYQMGFLTGRNFSAMIKSRVAQDQILQHQLLPFALTPRAEPLLESICLANRQRYPRYWQELLGIAGGSGVPILHVEISPDLFLIAFSPKLKHISCVHGDRYCC